MNDILGLRKAKFGNRVCFFGRFLHMCIMSGFGSSLPVEGY